MAASNLAKPCGPPCFMPHQYNVQLLSSEDTAQSKHLGNDFLFPQQHTRWSSSSPSALPALTPLR